MKKRFFKKRVNRGDLAKAAREQLALMNKCRRRELKWEPDWRPFGQEW